MDNNLENLNADNIIEKLRETFKDEAYELLAELESALLELERNPGDMEQIGRVFRAMHTIKGSGASCEFNHIAAFTHELETAFDMVRKGKIQATKEIIDLALVARDHIHSLFDAYYKNGTSDESKSEEITAALKKLLPAASVVKTTATPKPVPVEQRTETGSYITYRIRFRPPQDLFISGTNPLLLLQELRQLGPCRVVAQTDAIPYLEDYQPEASYTFWDVILTTNRGINAIQDIFIFVKDTSELTIEVIDRDGGLENEAMYKKLGEILVERGDISREDLQKALKSKRRVGEVLVETGVVSSNKIESALAEQQHVREMRDQREQRQSAGDAGTSSIRVPTKRLDTLVNLVGELVTVQARLSQTALLHGIPQFLAIAEEVERLTVSLRDNTMNIRMLPIGTTFSKFKRVVRDLSAELGKEIELTTEGAETELDKTVIERLSDPLIHLIRNCIDHGIEPPDARAAKGKPRRGNVHLAASHSGPNVLITVRDDGAGLDPEAIRLKAIEKGMIAADVQMSDKDLFALVLMPDFSTARKVTSVSGRGVGLDVVKRAIESLRGTVEISSVRGAGATITLKLPLTLAIIDGFLTRIGSEHFIFELTMVQECIELTREAAARSSGRNFVNVRGSIVPYIRLRDQFAMGGEPAAIEQVVIVQENGHSVGFVVDTVIGEHQTVLKSLGKFYQGVEGISGATILGDGTVALILDIPKLIAIAERQESQLISGDRV